MRSLHASGAGLCAMGVFAGIALLAADFKTLTSPRDPTPRVSEPAALVPLHSYKTWSLFLVNNPSWAVSESNAKLRSLYDEFEAFGKAIGPDHVTIWFWSTNRVNFNPFTEDTDQETSAGKRLFGAQKLLPMNRAVDVARSAKFCEKLHLPPSSGPYVLVTNVYPGEGRMDDPSTFLPTPLESHYTISLNNKSADEIMQVLSRVADKITADRLRELDTNSASWWEGWTRAFVSIRQTLASLRISVRIKTPWSEVNIS